MAFLEVMKIHEIALGKGRARVYLSARHLGDNLIVCIFNENAHIGAVAVGEYDQKEKRTSASVITRMGHKDDVIAQSAAHSISKFTQKAVCVVVGIHVDKITKGEIADILENADRLVDEFLAACL